MKDLTKNKRRHERNRLLISIVCFYKHCIKKILINITL